MLQLLGGVPQHFVRARACWSLPSSSTSRPSASVYDCEWLAHVCCLRSGDGRPYSWGGKETGLLPFCALHHLGHGHDNGPCVRAPARMVGLDDQQLVEVAAGYEHTLLLNEAGQVFPAETRKEGVWAMEIISTSPSPGASKAAS